MAMTVLPDRYTHNIAHQTVHILGILRGSVASVRAVSSGEHVVSGQQHAAAGVATEELQRSLTTQKSDLC